MARELTAAELLIDEATLAHERYKIEGESAIEAREKRDQLIFDCYNAGWSVYSISQALTLREPTIWTILRKMKLRNNA